MTSNQVQGNARSAATGRYVVPVSKATVAAARGRVVVARRLGKPVPKATAKIAEAR